MLKGQAHTFRSRSRLAVSLSWVAGYTNVITLVAAGQTVSHQTGNTTHLGEQLGNALLGNRAALTEAAYFAGLVVAFLAGAALSGTMTEAARRTGRRSRFVLPMTVEAVLLTVVAAMIHHDPHPEHGAPLVAVTLIAALAMGLQNATITRISGAVVRTTHLTGVLTDLGLELSLIGAGVLDALRAGRGRRAWRTAHRRAGVQRAFLLAAIFASFLTGAAGGKLAFESAHAYALLVPVLFLAALVVREQMAAVAEVQPLAVPAEWAGLLPPSVALFRLAHRTAGRPHHPPDFTAWAERLPAHWRVVILMVDPLTRFPPDAAISLLSAADLLRSDGRTLIVAGLGRRQLQLLRHCDPHHRIKWHDFPPDLEFAVARALSLVEASPSALPAAKGPPVG